MSRRAAELRRRIARHLKEVSPLLILRLSLTVLVFVPWLLVCLALSWSQLRRWRRTETCRAFIRRQRLAFPDLDESTLEVRSLPGGVSNANQIWRCRSRNGGDHRYFVKVFLPVGSFWAKRLHLVSPFPAIYGDRVHERFTIDMISRVQLDERGIAVPRLVAFDPVEKVMVTDYLEGRTVDDVLAGITTRGSVGPEDLDVVRQCGEELAKVHNAGFSLIDTQPVNCIWTPASGRVFFTDLEYCTRQDRRLWDVGFFLCFLALRLPAEVKRQVRESFLKSYHAERPLDLSGVAETAFQLEAYLPFMRMILDVRQFTPEELFEGLFGVPSASPQDE